MKNRNLEQMKNDIEVVRAEIKDAVEKNKPMEYIQQLINLENTIGNLIVQQTA